jgi:hypothetical protein
MSLREEYMEARQDADNALLACDVYGGQIEDGENGLPELAILLAARAVALAIRELSVTVAYFAPDGPV